MTRSYTVEDRNLQKNNCLRVELQLPFTDSYCFWCWIRVRCSYNILPFTSAWDASHAVLSFLRSYCCLWPLFYSDSSSCFSVSSEYPSFIILNKKFSVDIGYLGYIYILYIFFFLWLYSPILGLGRLHETFHFISISRSRTVGRTAWTGDQLVARLLLNAPSECDDDRGVGGMNGFGRGNRSTRRKPAPTPLCPLEIPLARSGCEPGPPLWDASDCFSYGAAVYSIIYI
jgi:hypothetical protein